MKTLWFSSLIVAFIFFCTNGTQSQTIQTNLNKVVIGSIDSIHSKILNEQRKIWVYVPDTTSIDNHSKKHYPVVYLLDGELHFYSVVGMIQQLSSVNGNTVIPEMIVVGIPNTDRIRDLSPTRINSTTGGGEKFVSFIEKELIPYIDSLYPTTYYRMFIGHSLGGLLVMNTLIHHTNLFRSYVAIDPSMWWDNMKILKETKITLADNTYPGISLFLGIANTIGKGLDTLMVKKDTSSNSEHIRCILELNDYLSINKQNQLKYACKYYENDSHTSVPLIAEYDALRFVFNDYNFKLSSSEYKNVNRALISKMENHFDILSKQIGYTVKPHEGLVIWLGYNALELKNFDDAFYLFKLNVVNFPKSSNVYDSLGDYYVAKDDKSNAIESFKKALSLKEDPDTRKKLEDLQSK